MPDGPSRPLWPGIATAEAPSAGDVERDVAGALRGVDDERALRSAASAAIAATGSSTPVTFDACVATARHGSGPRERRPLVEVDLAGVPVGADDAIVQRPRRSSSRSGRITADRVRAGDDWRREVDAALDRADVALLLISADFLASDFPPGR